MSSETFTDINDLIEKATGDPVFAESVREQSRSRQIVKWLAATRAANNISQSAIADELGCNQSKISKIENGYDESVNIKELGAYAKVLNRDVNVVFTERNQGLVSKVKMHALAFRDSFLELVKLADGDSVIARGIARFNFEAYINFALILQEIADKIPKHPETGEPYIEISVVDIKVSEEEIQLEAPTLLRAFPSNEHESTST